MEKQIPDLRGARKIFFLRTDSIGDNVLAASMLAPIAEHFAGAEIWVICQEHIQELYETCPYVRGSIGFNYKQLLHEPAYQSQLASQLASLEADLLLNTIYSPDIVSEFLAAHARAKVKIGFVGDLANRPKEMQITHSAIYTHQVASQQMQLSELERHAEFLQAIGISNRELQPQIWLSAADIEQGKRLTNDQPQLVSRPIVALSPCAQYKIKDYPNFASAINQSGITKDHSFVTLGGSADRQDCEDLLKALDAPTLNLCGQTSLRVCAAIIKGSRISLGSDTVAAHMACALGVPNLVVLGGGHFARFLPYSALTSIIALPLSCYQCSWQCKFARPHCVKDLSPAVVASAIRQSLSWSSTRARVFIQEESRAALSQEVSWQDPQRFLPSSKVEYFWMPR